MRWCCFGKQYSSMANYSVAILAVMLATLVRMGLGPHVQHQLPFVTYYVAVIVVAWHCGFRPAVLSMLLGFLAANWFFIGPAGTVQIETMGDIFVTVGYFAVTITIALFARAMHQARDRASKRQRELEREIEERERAEKAKAESEERLRQSQKLQAVGELAGGVAHNINNLLMVISGNLELLGGVTDKLQSLEDQATSRQAMQQLRQAVDMGASLTRQILAFCRRETSQPIAVHPNDTIMGIRNILESVLGSKITLLLELDDHVGCIYVDPGRIEEVILNLATNGRDAMPQGGKLTISTETAVLNEMESATRRVRPGSYVSIAVRDNGKGMDANTRSRLFEPFFTTKTKGQGTGMGLANVYGFVKQTGGCIEVESEPGRGSLFRLLIPVSHETLALPHKKARVSPQAANGGTVLLCEDNTMLRQLIKKYLSENRCTVLDVADAEKAVEIVSQHHDDIDFLITDIQLPGMDGLKLASELQARRPMLKCVIISGHPERIAEYVNGNTPTRRFLHKPFQMPDLIQAMADMSETLSRQVPPKSSPDALAIPE